MNKSLRKLTILGLAPVVMFSALSASSVAMAEDKAEVTGKELSFDRKKGNCLACHMIPGGEMPGNLAPPLIGMAARYPDKKVLRDQIWDPQVKNPDSMMPPFGKHQIVSEEELDKIVDFIAAQ